jgi:hypothetical protein
MKSKIARLYLLRALRPTVIHRLPGRLRIHIPALKRAEGRRKEWIREWQRLLELPPAVRSVELNFCTGNALVRFDPAEMTEREILGFLQALGRLIVENWEHLTPCCADGVAALIDKLRDRVRWATERRRTLDAEVLSLHDLSQ